jgi:hypothetical protein
VIYPVAVEMDRNNLGTHDNETVSDMSIAKDEQVKNRDCHCNLAFSCSTHRAHKGYPVEP